MKLDKQLTPENYIRTKARSLPIAECYVNADWHDYGMAQIFVARSHTNGHYTVGIYLVDTFALGVKDSFFRFNIPRADLDELIEAVASRYDEEIVQGFSKTDYAIVHNIIYGAIAFAEEFNFKTCKEFALTQYILEEDDDAIELIEYEFGKDGVPFIIT